MKWPKKISHRVSSILLRVLLAAAQGYSQENHIFSYLNPILTAFQKTMYETFVKVGRLPPNSSDYKTIR
jgi:hypothetical protein